MNPCKHASSSYQVDKNFIHYRVPLSYSYKFDSCIGFKRS